MADLNRYFDVNESASSHWFSANSLPQQDQPPSSYNDSLDYYVPKKKIDEEPPVSYDPEFSQRMREFDASLQEKLREEMLEEEVLFVRKWTNTGLQIVALITEHLVSHPFIVLRRQCQVNNKSLRYHILPITLVPVVVNIHRWQGITCLWKGVGSVLVIKGLTLAVQDLISKITLWPKEVTLDSSAKYISKHVLLKCLTCAIITPFYSASLLETVQSEIACEKPEFLDIFKEGFRRFISLGAPQKGRMLPVWSLIMPTAVYFIARHLFVLFMKTVISKIIILNQDFQHRRQGAIPKDINYKDNQSIELTSSLMAVLSADIVLYPLETILHRLHLQGTRTIIDNLDDGSSVTPILTNFEGVSDCYEATIREEGNAGLYKGFGSLILQCVTYASIIKLSKFVFTQVSILFCKSESGYIKESYRPSVSPSQPLAKCKKIVRVKQRPKYDFSSDSEGFEESANTVHRIL